jgi:hypothetical protein
LEDDFHVRRNEYEYLEEEMTARLKSYQQDRNAREDWEMKNEDVRFKIQAHLKSDYSLS